MQISESVRENNTKATYTHTFRVFKLELSTPVHYKRMNSVLTAFVSGMSNVPTASL